MEHTTSKLFDGLTVLIVGLGGYTEGSGVAAAQFFAKHGARMLINDIETRGQLRDNVRAIETTKNIEKCVFGRHDVTLIDEADVVFQNPGVPDMSEMMVYANTANKPIINDWTMFFLHPKPRCIGITGTRGKSTTTSLIYEMMKRKHADARIAGNIGVSPLTFLDGYRGEWVVAELSSWLLRGLSPVNKSPHIAVVTNIMNDHQNMYPSMDAYIRDKEHIFRHQTKADTVVLNHDDKIVRAMKQRAPGKVLWFGKSIPRGEDGVYLERGCIMYRGRGRERCILREGDSPLIGEHNTCNIMAAVAAAKAHRIADKHIVDAVRSFKGVAFRLEYQRTFRGIDLYNDSTSTTPDAAIAAINAFVEKRDVVLIAGGADKRLDYTEWARIASQHTKSIILIPGDATNKMIQAMKTFKYNPILVPNLKAALESALTIAQAGDNIIFSPGAASFNMFKNEFDRGEAFNKLVFALPNHRAR